MKRLQAFKFQIEPNGDQIRAMRQYAGNARRIWNLALNRQQELHAAGEKFTNSFGMNNWLPAWKQEFPYLCDSPSQTLHQVTKDLAAAYKNFFERRADFPQFKKKGRSSDSFRFPQGFEIDEANSRIRFPKLGWIRYRKSRKVKFSNNWKKAKAHITKLHQRVARTRNDFLHKTSNIISKSHAMIVIEDLKVTNMSKSAAGTLEAPGRSVKAKSGLNKSILDQGWGEFHRQSSQH